jgi:hypothetical protein
MAALVTRKNQVCTSNPVQGLGLKVTLPAQVALEIKFNTSPNKLSEDNS